MNKEAHTLVIGASENPERFSNMAIRRLRLRNYTVVAIGARAGQVLDVPIQTGFPALSAIDTVTLYINPNLQEPYYKYLLALKPRRIIFNPGTENETLATLAQAEGISTLDACTLVMLSTGQY